MANSPVGGDVGGQQVDVIEALDRRSPPHVALGHVLQRRAQMVRRVVALGFEVDLEPMPVRVVELVGRAVAEVAVDPAQPEPGRLDRLGPPLERLRAPGAQRDVTETGKL